MTEIKALADKDLREKLENAVAARRDIARLQTELRARELNK